MLSGRLRKRLGSRKASADSRQSNQRDWTSYKPIDMTKTECLSQTQSPLFSKLPAEVRALIWEYALLRYTIPSTNWEKGAYWYRPDYPGPHHLTVGLLQSCRLIYHEAHHLPMAQAEHVFWFDAHRAPWPMDAEYFKKLAPVQRAEVNRVQLCAQSCFIENGQLRNFFAGPEFSPKHLTLTIRHSDFWWWEDDHPLTVTEYVEQNFQLPDSVETFVLRLETLVRRKKQLEDIVTDIVRRRKFVKLDGTEMLPDEKATRRWEWVGKFPQGTRTDVEGKNYASQDAHFYVVDIVFRKSSDSGLSSP